MSTKPENTFIKGVHSHLDKKVYRMKNHNVYVAGVPDVWYSGKGNSLWVEYKYTPIQKPRTIVIPDLTPQQLYWITARRNEGRNIKIILGCKPGGVIYTDMDDIVAGLEPAVFMDRLLSRKELAEKIYRYCHLGVEI